MDRRTSFHISCSPYWTVGLPIYSRPEAIYFKVICFLPEKMGENSPQALALLRGPTYHPLALSRATVGAGILTALVMGLVVSGCATSGGVKTGFLSLRGVEQTLVLAQSGEDLTLRARPEILAQLDRLVDARVRVMGFVQGSGISVRDFELLEAPDGMVPFVGRIVVDQSGTRLDEEPGGTPIFLRGDSLRALRRQHGARVWITGSVVGEQTLLIAHWGVLVPPE